MLFENLEIENSEIIEIPVTDPTLQEFPFPQNLSTVEGGDVLAIVAYSAAQITKTPTGKTVVNAACLNKSYVVLRKKDSGRDDLNKFPMQDLLRSANAGVVTKFAPMQIDFSQSKIVVADVANNVLNENFLMLVIYKKK